MKTRAIGNNFNNGRMKREPQKPAKQRNGSSGPVLTEIKNMQHYDKNNLISSEAVTHKNFNQTSSCHYKTVLLPDGSIDFSASASLVASTNDHSFADKENLVCVVFLKLLVMLMMLLLLLIFLILFVLSKLLLLIFLFC
eukprot:TRINITY_DN2432_c0_g1_i2.p1 TRINITY_DN2432_c0_g1~~TRINITY_DN2432_c0_g1_i2.p1  ORF type:complete len:139 (-),score=6.60 TRINITY_DN2432_c0_g1_i2:178-594(-)